MTFGHFDSICRKTSFPVCNLIGPYGTANSSTPAGWDSGIMADCYPRSINVANTMIFSVGTDFIHIGALLVLILILFNVKSKITAVGRSGMLHFFSLYVLLTILSLVIDSGVTPPGSASYPYFVSIQCGVASAVSACLLFNGFWGYDLFADDTRRTILALRSVCLAAFALTFVIALLTFQGWVSSLQPDKTVALFVVLYILNAIMVAAYVILQLVLCIVYLNDWWAAGAILLGCFFFIAGQILMYVFSHTICDHVKHYIDGVFFATVCNMFTVMMIYKYWDMITMEDLEFAVSNAQSNWDVKEYMDDRYDDGYSEYASSTFAFNSGNQPGKGRVGE